MGCIPVEQNPEKLRMFRENKLQNKGLQVKLTKAGVKRHGFSPWVFLETPHGIRKYSTPLKIFTKTGTQKSLPTVGWFQMIFLLAVRDF